PHNYGPRQHGERSAPRQSRGPIAGIPPRLYGAGLYVRDWIHVEDHCRAVLEVLLRGEIGRTYLVGADGERSNLDIARDLLVHFGRDPGAIDFVADRPGHDRRYAIDASRLRDELGWRPLITDFAAGLADTVDWYRGHESWWRPQKSATEAGYASRGQ